ncbi:MAG: alpha/beta hydrolase fold domain-containing protein, partial [Bacteroidia bacterium]
MRPSFQSRLISGILKLISLKTIVEKQAKKPIKRSKKAFLPQKIEQSYLSKSQTCNGKAFATFESKEKVSQDHIIFLHGGAYIFEASTGHWDLAKKIVDKSFCRMTLVDYPLAPE